MSKIARGFANPFFDHIERDRNWRIREISDFKSSVDDSKNTPDQRNAIQRASVTMCYAHWEGHVKFSSRHYLEHISSLGLTYAVLNIQFYRNRFISRLESLSNSNSERIGICKIVDDICGSKQKIFEYIDEKLLNTGSNLKFKKLSEVCLLCGIDPSVFEQESNCSGHL